MQTFSRGVRVWTRMQSALAHARVFVCAGDHVQMGRQASQKVTVVVLLFRKVMVWMLERIFRWCPARVTPMCRRSLEQKKKRCK